MATSDSFSSTDSGPLYTSDSVADSGARRRRYQRDGAGHVTVGGGHVPLRVEERTLCAVCGREERRGGLHRVQPRHRHRTVLQPSADRDRREVRRGREEDGRGVERREVGGRRAVGGVVDAGAGCPRGERHRALL
eukprot:539610-Rhodomonas_salina.1